MRRTAGVLRDQRGVALVTVLLFMVLIFILISAMLLTASNEAVIAALHRDGVRAEEYAQAGLEDAIRRMEGARAWKPGAVDPSDVCTQQGGLQGFKTALPDGDICVTVTTRLPGPSASFLEIRSDAAVGRGRRQLSTLVLAKVRATPPDIFFGYSLAEGGNAEVGSGEVYAETFVRYKDDTSSTRATFAGWRIRKVQPNPQIDPCYTHAECVAAGRPQWWPGHRRTVYRTEVFRPSTTPMPPENLTPDPRTAATAFAGIDCTDGYGPSDAHFTETIGSNGPGYNAALDKRADLNPSDPAQANIASEKLYGCTTDGFPYTWVREAFDSDDDNNSDPDKYMWFKVIVFDDWFSKYWCFNDAPDKLTFEPCNGFHPSDTTKGDPSLGAVPPFPDFDALAQNYDEYMTGGGTISASTSIDFGTCTDPIACNSPANTPTVVLLENGNYKINCSGSCPPGHGLLLVDGDLEINGNFTYYGTVIVRGTLTMGNGTATIYGGLVAQSTAEISGTIRIFAGGMVANVLAGPLEVIGRTWWER